MNLASIQAIALRDLKIVLRSKGVMLPMIIVPIIIMVLFPAGIGIFAPYMESLERSELDDMETFFAQMPAEMRAQFVDYTPAQTLIVTMVVYLFAPMFLIMPLMTASTIAANSFAGEKERKTLEALIYTPTTDAELFVGKMLAAWIPAIVVSLGSFVLYGLSANLAAWPTMGHVFFPNLMWFGLVLWVTPAAAGLGLGVVILISSKVNSFQEASQIAGVIVLPIVMLMLGQIAGVLYLNLAAILIVGAILWLIDAIVLWFAVRTFKRDEIIARL